MHSSGLEITAWCQISRRFCTFQYTALSKSILSAMFGPVPHVETVRALALAVPFSVSLRRYFKNHSEHRNVTTKNWRYFEIFIETGMKIKLNQFTFFKIRNSAQKKYTDLKPHPKLRGETWKFFLHKKKPNQPQWTRSVYCNESPRRRADSIKVELFSDKKSELFFYFIREFCSHNMLN